MTTNLGAVRAGIGTIALDDDADWTLLLTPVGAPTWPDGTTAWIKFYDNVQTYLQMNGTVTAEQIMFTLQQENTPKPADIPDGCRFKIRVSLPGTPRTEAIVWRGGVTKES